MNVIGAQTLFFKEVRRFLRVPGQTVLQPLSSTSLYFVVFAYTVGAHQSEVEGVPYVQFIVPGLVFLGIANNAFLNASSSFFIAKSSPGWWRCSSPAVTWCTSGARRSSSCCPRTCSRCSG